MWQYEKRAQNFGHLSKMVKCFWRIKVLLNNLLLLQEVDAESGGRSALMYAAEKGNLEIVKLLVSYGADMNLENQYGLTPLMAAANFGQIEVIKYFLESGVAPDTVDNFGETAAYKAAQTSENEEYF